MFPRISTSECTYFVQVFTNTNVLYSLGLYPVDNMINRFYSPDRVQCDNLTPVTFNCPVPIPLKNLCASVVE